MWARIVEFMIALWLAMSPFIFAHAKTDYFLWTNDFTCSILISFFSLICYYRPLRKMHLCNLLVAFWLVGLGYFLEDVPLPPALQNAVVVGWILMMLALIPTDSELSPVPWRKFYGEQS